MLSKSRFLFSRVLISRNFCKDPLKDRIMDQMKNKDQQQAKASPGIFYGAAACIIFAMGYMQYVLKTPQKEKTSTIQVIGQAAIGGAWRALSGEGNQVQDTDFLGKYIIYYFGFTRCPDICPASLQKLAFAIDLLNKKGYKNIEYLFISIDPQSDTPDKVQKYTKVFHSQMKGILVPSEELPSFMKTFRIYARKIYEGDEYMLDHTTYMYFFNKQGKFVDVLGANFSYDELAEKIEQLVKANN